MPEPYVGKEFLRQQNNKQKTLTSNLRPPQRSAFLFLLHLCLSTTARAKI